jgi:hypothetical protein
LDRWVWSRIGYGYGFGSGSIKVMRLLAFYVCGFLASAFYVSPLL